MSMPAEQPRYYTIQEYLRMERASDVKHEYVNGEILAMSGGTPAHSLISANTSGEIRNALKGKPCRVYDSNFRVRIPRSPLYMYPDISIACSKLDFDPADEQKETYSNPTVLIEVLSKSTEGYDRGVKFRQYRKIESLREYVLISQDMPAIETYFRNSDGQWVIDSYAELNGTLLLKSLDLRIPLTEIYAGITFPPQMQPDSSHQPKS
jgi:Uma2 family endonuclease